MTTKTKDKTFNWVGFIGMLMLVYFLYNQCSHYNSEQEDATLITALQDSLKTWQTVDNTNKARISVLETSNIARFLTIKSKDSTIIHLQKIIAENKDKLGSGSSVTTGTTETKGQGTSTKTQIVYVEKDTAYFNEFNFGGWIWGSSLATKDSTTYDFNVKNTFDLVIGEEKTGFLGTGKPRPFVEMTNYNPYTTTKELRTYRVSAPKPYNLIIGPGISYGLGGWTFGINATVPLLKFRL